MDVYNSNILKSSDLTKDNYSPILRGPKYGYGNVTLDDLSFEFLELGFFNHNINYPLIINDYDSGALNISIESIKYLETISPAIWDNLDKNIKNSREITVKINETLKFSYNNPGQDYLIYRSRYPDTELLEVHVNNGTEVTVPTNGTDYFLDENSFLIFRYKSYFKKSQNFNFTMHLIWLFTLKLIEWEIKQLRDEPLMIRNNGDELITKFSYEFFLAGNRYAFNIQDITPISYIYTALTINLPDKEVLSDHSLQLNLFNKDVSSYMNPDGSFKIEISDKFAPNASLFSLNFTTPFTLRFEEAVSDTWAIDRLLTGRNVRERTYIVSVISGPDHFFIKDVRFKEHRIFFEDVVGNYSLFERNVVYDESNTTFSDRLTITVAIPFIIKGEVIPFSIRYLASEQLRIVVTDNIKMPLVGATLEILYEGAVYGTYISNSTSQPLDPGKTDENGEIFINDLPSGNYTIRVFHRGQFLKEVQANTNTGFISIRTNFPHFPLWILIFGLINTIILIFGFLFYRKNQKSR
jgi:hypothetical protein